MTGGGDALRPFQGYDDRPTSSATNGSGKRVARAFDAQLGSAPLLHVEYQIDSTAPSTPTGLTATAQSSSQINLSWSAATDNVAVAGYRVYRNGTQVATSTGTTYSNTGLTAGTAYSYTVAAYDTAGNVSPQSASVNATTLPAGTTPQTLTFAAVADATVRSDTPTTNYGGATFLEVDNSPVQDLLVKFTVTVPAGKTVTSAKLATLRHRGVGEGRRRLPHREYDLGPHGAVGLRRS